MANEVRIKGVQYGRGGGNALYHGRPWSELPPSKGRVVVRSDGSDVIVVYQAGDGERVLRFSAAVWDDVYQAGLNAMFRWGTM